GEKALGTWIANAPLPLAGCHVHLERRELLAFLGELRHARLVLRICPCGHLSEGDIEQDDRRHDGPGHLHLVRIIEIPGSWCEQPGEKAMLGRFFLKSLLAAAILKHEDAED